MSRAPAYPPVDPRRASRLRDDLLRDIAALAPDWRGVAEAAGHDRALVEIAARLMEQATRRLDRMPERDALAFLDFYDIPAPEPRAAEGIAVFALAEDRAGSETLAAGAALEIADRRSGEPVKFETTEDLPVHAARIACLASVDAAADTINLSPPQVIALEDDGVPAVTYLLEATAGAGDRVIRLSHAVGIAEGDLLRVAARDGGAPRFLSVTAVSEDGLVELAEPLAAALAETAVAGITRMTAFEPFAMPDHQEHALYIGDPDALAVVEPADIWLGIAMAEGSPDLFEADVEVEAWGLREGPGTPEEAPRWHRLPPLGPKNGRHGFLKGWTGPIEEFEIAPGVKNRWLRLRRTAPINGAGDAVPMADRIEIALETFPPEPEAETTTISQVAHNAAALPLPEFLPFGAEPRQFDSFALAAPETFNKYGARAVIDIRLLDATLASAVAALRRDGRPHLYGIGGNGRLQAIDLTAAVQEWYEVKAPESDDGQSLRLDPGFAPLAAEYHRNDATFARDIVVAADDDGGLWSARVSLRRGAPSGDEPGMTATLWYPLPALNGDLPAAATRGLAAVPTEIAPPPPISGVWQRVFLWHLTAEALYRLAITYEGGPEGDSWIETAIGDDGARPADLGANPRLIPATASFAEDDGDFGVVAGDGRLWVLRITDNLPRWQALALENGDPILVEDTIAPALHAYRDEADVPHMALAWAAPGGAGLRYAIYDVSQPGPVWVAFDQIGDAVRRIRLVAGIDLTARPSVLATRGTGAATEILDWTPDTETGVDSGLFRKSLSAAVPAAAAAGPVAAFSATDATPATIVVAGAEETLFRLDLNRSAWAEFLTWISSDDGAPAPDETVFADMLVAWSRTGVAPEDQDRAEPAEFVAEHAITGHRLAGLSGTAGIDRDRPIRLFRDPGHDDVTVTAVSGGDLGFDNAPAVDPTPTAGDFLLVQVGDPVLRQAAFPCAGADAASGTDPGKATVAASEQQRLDDFLGSALADGEVVRFRVLDLQSEVAANSPDHYGTLAILTGTDSRPQSISLDARVATAIDTADVPLVALSPLTAAAVILPSWGVDFPDEERIVKLQAAAPQPGDPGEPLQAFSVETLARDFKAPELAWEYYNGRGWKRLDRDFADTTANLSVSGQVAFRIPPDLSPVAIGGQEDLWIRARLVGGDYGRPKYVITTEEIDSETTVQSVSVDTDHMRPPEIGRIAAHFEDMPPAAPAAVIARNNLRDIDQAAANRVAGAVWPVFQGAGQVPPGAGGGRSLLLGLTRPLPAGLATLYLRAEDRDGPVPDTLRIETLGADLAWADAPLAEDDPTRGLNQSGLLTFAVTEEPAQVALLGTPAPLYWLRLTGGPAGWRPKITGLWLNGTPILQAETVRQELLGTSLGEPGLALQLLKAPILEGSLELRVRERLSDEEVAELRAAAEDDGPDPVLEAVPNIPGQWVLWTRVQTLAGQGDGRVYLATPEGAVTFGDGRDGRIPPAGADGIRAFRYRTGGVTVEAAAMAEVKVRNPVPGHDTAFAPDPIAGGSQRPPAEELVRRMPAALRHQGSGLSLSDLEDLTRDIDSDIVQVRADPATGPEGAVRVTVLARGDSRRPVYRRAKRDNLALALARAASDAWPESCIEVASARIVEIAITVRLTATAGRLTRLNAAANTALARFLHAAEGGPEGRGWPIGRRPWPVDIERALAPLDSLDRVVAVEIARADGAPLGPLGPGEVAGVADLSALRVLVVGEAAP